MECFSAPSTFEGHYDEYPVQEALASNTFVPEVDDMEKGFLGSLLTSRDTNFPRGKATLNTLNLENREALARGVREAQLNFSWPCATQAFNLVPNGAEIPVNEVNYVDYVYRSEMLFNSFRDRELCFAVLEDDPENLIGLVPDDVPTAGRHDSSVTLSRVLEQGEPTMEWMQWFAPGTIEFSSALPLGLQRRKPAMEGYTHAFLFCRMGTVLAIRCLGWATLDRAEDLRRRLLGLNSIHVSASSHVNNVRGLREGYTHHQQHPQYPPPQHQQHQPLPSASISFGNGNASLSYRTQREQEELCKSLYLREHAVPNPLTEEDRLLYSPTHEVPGILAPIQAINK